MGIRESKQKLQNSLKTMPAHYAEGMSGFFGQDVSNSPAVANYRAKITPATADRWEKNLKRAFGL